jgi:hypothetical protein
MGESDEMEQQEFWRSLAPLAESIVFFLSVDIALEALWREDRRDMDCFSRRYLGRVLPPPELLALYQILTRSEKWRKVGWPASTRYLGYSTRRAGRRIRRDGILKREQREKETRAARELDQRRTHILRPDHRLERKEEREFQARIMERVHARIRERGTERDCMILDLREKGRSPAEAISELGLKWSAWEALRRKMERWGRKEVENLRSEMSSRGVSAA